MKFISMYFLFFLGNHLIAKNYQIGDTLNVFARGGLNLRDAPRLNGEKILNLKYSEKVVVLNHFNFDKYLDTIEARPGNWIFIKTILGIEGFLFDGYLSSLPPPKITEGVVTYFNSNYKTKSCEIEYLTPYIDEKEATSCEITQFDNGQITFIKRGGYESWSYCIIFKERRFAELISLVELFYEEGGNLSLHEGWNFSEILKKAAKKNSNVLVLKTKDGNLIITIKNGFKEKSIEISETY